VCVCVQACLANSSAPAGSANSSACVCNAGASGPNGENLKTKLNLYPNRLVGSLPDMYLKLLILLYVCPHTAYEVH
jgi:hypothetical protein